MLNPELQKNINEEIKKTDVNTEEFLSSQYFRETIDMISRVNKLNLEQSESLELEIILFILKISEYENFFDAVKNEIGLETEGGMNQASKDVETYIFSKLTQTLEKVESLKTNEIKINTPNLQEKEVVIVSENSTLRDTIKQEIYNPKTETLLDKKGYNYEPKYINPEENSVLKSGESFSFSNINEEVKMGKLVTVPKIELPKTLGDVYTEKIDDLDKVIPKEFSVLSNKKVDNDL
jgi:hypothetical protein